MPPLRIVFAGTPDFAALHLAALIESPHQVIAVVTQPDRPGKRGKALQPSPVKQIAADHGLPLFQPPRLDRETEARLADLEPDAMVVVAYGQILSADILRLPTYGCINVHTSLLPRWRGAAPIQRAIQAGDVVSGVSIMLMDEGLDTGPLLRVSEHPIAGTDTTASYENKLAEIGPPALLAALEDYVTGRIEPRPQPQSGISYARKIAKDEAEIAWHESAPHIARTIRALVPNPVAFSHIGGMRAKIWEASPEPSPSRARADGATPGAILDMDRRGIRVQCGDGVLAITGIQLPIGKGKVLTPLDILNGRNDLFAPGAAFEPANANA